ncbi:hypothetical protein BC831DRAFT_485253 [Entophlyctis helioformis]|nr:hypothetical protein BC831DRAFT_485253 [Entophlyctis helioformis]
MVAQAKVVLTTVGPYAQHGEKLVSACVRIKTDYVDLTGEPQFVRRMAEKYHDLAVQNNVLIVNGCGMDSIPSDLGTFLVADLLATAKGLQTQQVKYSLVEGSGGFSGGTIASLGLIASDLSPAEFAELKANANYAVPESKEVIPAKSVVNTFDKDFDSYQTVAIMELPNIRNVYRSHWFNKYGPDFEYTESSTCPNYFGSLAMTSVVYSLFGVMWSSIGLKMMLRMMPQGSGPSDESIKKGFFTIHLIGKSTPNAAGEVVKAKAIVKGTSDPGYGETSKMISESALCLALQRHQIGTSATGSFKSMTGGVVTPSTSMGMLLVERLRKAGMTFDVALL